VGKPVSLISNLQRAACVERLREAADAPLVAFGKKPVIASVRDDKATLRKRLKARNSFQTCLRLRMADTRTGTRLDCRVGMHPAVIVFMTLWLGAVAVIGGAIFLSSLIAVTGAAQSEIPPAIGLAAPPAFLLFGLLLLFGGRAMARDEEAFLLDFVRQTLEARPAVQGDVMSGTVS
jgi:hypothetical protein